MRLVVPSEEWQAPFVAMALECESAGEPRYALALRDFNAYLLNVRNAASDQGLPVGQAPSTELWVEDGRQIVGCVRLRHGLTPGLESEGGHIGYDVRPSMRRRGYGTALLGLALIEARALGIHTVRVTCDDDNLGSIKIIERNGGVLTGRAISNESSKTVRQYLIHTPSAVSASPMR